MEIIKLRGHHLLCILGFRGKGYSPTFIENMTHVVDQLRGNSATPVKVRAEPDNICRQCPLLGENGCAEKGAESENSVVTHDLEVMRRLGIAPYAIIAWSDILNRLTAALTAADLEYLCRDCQWLPFGHCADGLAEAISGQLTSVQQPEGRSS